MAGMRRNVEQRGADVEVQVIETQAVEPVIIDVTPPTEDVEVVTVEYEQPSVAPTYVEDMGGSSYWPRAQRINVAVPEPQECYTPYVWVELSDP
jgi:hypothetical protein